MANPNIVSVAGIYANTQVQNITTAATTIVWNNAASGKVMKINTLFIANIDGVNAADVTIDLYRSSVAYKIINTVTVAADTSFTAIDKTLSLYLLEGDQLRLTASVNSRLTAVCSFEEIN
jgi:hypothetical protein